MKRIPSECFYDFARIKSKPVKFNNNLKIIQFFRVYRKFLCLPQLDKKGKLEFILRKDLACYGFSPKLMRSIYHNLDKNEEEKNTDISMLPVRCLVNFLTDDDKYNLFWLRVNSGRTRKQYIQDTHKGQ